MTAHEWVHVGGRRDDWQRGTLTDRDYRWYDFFCSKCGARREYDQSNDPNVKCVENDS